MQVGIVGFGSPSMAALLATMALTGHSTDSRGFRYVYKNDVDGERFAKSYPLDTMSSRADFLHKLRQQEMNYIESDALNFSQMKETASIFKEVF